MTDNFLDIADALVNEYLLKTESLFVNNRQTWIAHFAEHFLLTCNAVQKVQAESSLAPVTYLEYTMLYSNFASRKYLAEIRVYGDRSYLDNKQCIIGSCDISHIFYFFDKLWDELLKIRKRYIDLVSSRDVMTCMMKILPHFYSYFTNIARLAIADCVDYIQFTRINKNEKFIVYVGDYMALTENVYIENKTKNTGKLIEWFNENLACTYTFGDYSSLDFSECNLQNQDFRYASFRSSILKKASLANSSFERASFRYAYMENCALDNCCIHEADFSNTVLRNSSFIGAKAKAGLIDNIEWQFVGFSPASFRNADLTGADFTNAYLTGADFSGAILTDTVFTNSVLDNAVFSNSIDQLSDEQKRSIIVQGNCSAPSTGKGITVTAGFSSANKGVIAPKGLISLPRYSSYFVMEQLDNAPNIPLPITTEVQKIANLIKIDGIDYFSRYGLISDNLKKLIEKFMPGYNFELAVYMDSENPDVTALWIFNPPAYSDFEVAFRTDGHVSHITPANDDIPRIFMVKSPKGIRSIIIHLAVAESMLRRNIYGLKLTRILECT